MKKSWLLLLLLVSLGLNMGLGLRLMRSADGRQVKPVGRWGAGGTPGWERPAPGDSTGWNRIMGRRVEHLADRLALRPEQIEHIRQTQRTLFPRMRERRHRLLGARTRLRELLAAPEIDRSAVRGAMAEVGRWQAAADSLAAETVLLELEVLDPPQRVRYLDFLPDGAGRRGRMGRFEHQPPAH